MAGPTANRRLPIGEPLAPMHGWALCRESANECDNREGHFSSVVPPAPRLPRPRSGKRRPWSRHVAVVHAVCAGGQRAVVEGLYASLHLGTYVVIDLLELPAIAAGPSL